MKAAALQPEQGAQATTQDTETANRWTVHEKGQKEPTSASLQHRIPAGIRPCGWL